jgi:hypothetical protein
VVGCPTLDDVRKVIVDKHLKLTEQQQTELDELVEPKS